VSGPRERPSSTNLPWRAKCIVARKSVPLWQPIRQATRGLSGLEQAIATASSTGGPSFKFEENGKQFQLSKKGDKWRFCFGSSVQKRPFKLDAVTYTDLNQRNFTHIYINLCYSNGKPDIAIPVTRDLNILCGLPTKDANPTRTKLQVAPNLYFTPRSLEGIFLFLGEVAKTQLGIDSGVETRLADPTVVPNANSLAAIFLAVRNKLNDALLPMERFRQIFSELRTPFLLTLLGMTRPAKLWKFLPTFWPLKVLPRACQLLT